MKKSGKWRRLGAACTCGALGWEEKEYSCAIGASSKGFEVLKTRDSGSYISWRDRGLRQDDDTETASAQIRRSLD